MFPFNYYPPSFTGRRPTPRRGSRQLGCCSSNQRPLGGVGSNSDYYSGLRPPPFLFPPGPSFYLVNKVKGRAGDKGKGRGGEEGRGGISLRREMQINGAPDEDPARVKPRLGSSSGVASLFGERCK